MPWSAVWSLSVLCGGVLCCARLLLLACYLVLFLFLRSMFTFRSVLHLLGCCLLLCFCPFCAALPVRRVAVRCPWCCACVGLGLLRCAAQRVVMLCPLVLFLLSCTLVHCVVLCCSLWCFSLSFYGVRGSFCPCGVRRSASCCLVCVCGVALVSATLCRLLLCRAVVRLVVPCCVVCFFAALLLHLASSAAAARCCAPSVRAVLCCSAVLPAVCCAVCPCAVLRGASCAVLCSVVLALLRPFFPSAAPVPLWCWLV